MRSALGAVAILLMAAPSALGAQPSRAQRLTDDGAGLPRAFAEPPPSPSNLPGKQENMQVVGTFQVPGVRLGQIADVAVHKGYAYLNSWDDPNCVGGGTYVVDIRNPAAPQQVSFIPAEHPYYHGEGAHVVSIDVPGNRRDILAVNDETYGSNLVLEDPDCAPSDKTGGGFDLYDVSDPANPVTLVQGAGDRDPDNNPATPPRTVGNSYHSVFVWQDGPRAFLVASDNVEFTDVDVFDITNPTAPVQVGDWDLVEMFPEILDGEESNGGAVFHHDVVVKQIEGKQIMKVDYWDAGYVQLDVSDPANPTYVTDTTFASEDPLRPGLTPEGNAHQGEFSHDNQFLLTADEDFGAFRNVVRATSGPTTGREATGVEGDAEARISELPDGQVNGPSMFVGDACNPALIPAAPPDDGDPNTEDIALVERGGAAPGPDPFCGFAQKFDNTQARGWDAIIIFNQPRPDDGQVNMLTGEGGIPGVQMRRVDAIGDRGVLTDAPDDPPAGTDGPDIVIGQAFDGWGYAHLYDAKTSEELDQYAIDESRDPRFADGFGDLSIHEFATDPATNLAYSSYYAGGIRVLRFSRAAGLEEMGAYIADGGSNFWGVEQFTAANGERLIAGSDRDFGLVILRYTGPGAVGPTPVTPPPPPPAGPKAGRCANLLATTAGQALTGSAFGDEITGTEGPDTIDAAAGDDCVSGLGGNDDLRGGTGVDTIDGQRGNDRIRGDAGRGNLRGGRGNDRVSGSSARDVLFGNTGRDRLSGGRNRDQLFGGSARDRLNGGRGKDVIEAGTGNDRIFAKDGSVDRIDCGFGRDTVASRDRKDKLTSCENR